MPQGRSNEARLQAEQVLIAILSEIDQEETPLVVLGGLVPGHLTSGHQKLPAPQHMGTVDVDVCLNLLLDREGSFVQLENSLTDLGISPIDTYHGWRWQTASWGAPVVVEFLCDREDLRTGDIWKPPGCDHLGVCNLPGTRFAALDYEDISLAGELRGGENVEITARYASLDGYLMSKSFAVRYRGVDKDYYDLAYVLLHNHAGGPIQAARRLTSGKFTDDIRNHSTLFIEIRERYGNPRDYAPQSYAEQAYVMESNSSTEQLA